MPAPFFTSTAAFKNQYTALFDFLQPTAAALWNLRWQVGGYLATIPDATKEDLMGRFVQGSGIHSVNLRRAALEHTWEEQQEQLARFALINVIALYEGWLESTTTLFPSPSRRAKELQWPSLGARGQSSAGAREAVSALTRENSRMMEVCFTPTLRKAPKYSLGTIDGLLLTYRFFKELRNSIVHANGVATTITEAAYSNFSTLTRSDLGTKEVPQHSSVVSGASIHVTLRGVIGFCDIVLRIVTTIDAELSATRQAEQDFLTRWTAQYGRRYLKTKEEDRHKTIRNLAIYGGFPQPANIQALHDFLESRDLIWWK